MKKKIAFLFINDPYSTNSVQEGINILVSSIILNQKIAIFIINQGLLTIIQYGFKKKKYKKFISKLLLLKLYKIKKIYFCLNSKKYCFVSKTNYLQGKWIYKSKYQKIIKKFNVILTF